MTESWLAKVRATAPVPEIARADPADPGWARGGAYGRAALDAEVQRVTAAANGTRNHTLNRAAFALGQLVAGGEIEELVVVRELTAAADQVGLGRTETERTIHSGLSAGKADPRVAPARGWSTRDWPQINTERETGETSQVSGTETVETDEELAVRRRLRHEAAVRSELDRLRARTAAELLFAAERAADVPLFLATLRDLLLDTTGLDSIPEPVSLVRGVLYLDSLAWLIGRPGAGKSFVALDMAGAVGTGQTWQDTPATRGNVLYLAAEGATGVKQRVRAWESANGQVMSGVRFLPRAVQAADPGQWSALVELAREMQPSLIVIDTQARVTVGMEENSATDMGLFVERLEELRRSCGACVLVVHHQGRNGEHMRGSTALEGAANTVIKVTKEDDLIDLECSKQKDAVEFDKIKLRLVQHGSSAILSLIFGETPLRTDTVTLRRMLMDWWNSHETDWVSVTTLVESRIVTKATFHRTKKALEAAHIVQSAGDGISRRYRLTQKPDLE
jgi:hypothetical protein